LPHAGNGTRLKSSREAKGARPLAAGGTSCDASRSGLEGDPACLWHPAMEGSRRRAAGARFFTRGRRRFDQGGLGLLPAGQDWRRIGQGEAAGLALKAEHRRRRGQNEKGLLGATQKAFFEKLRFEEGYFP